MAMESYKSGAVGVASVYFRHYFIAVALLSLAFILVTVTTDARAASLSDDKTTPGSGGYIDQLPVEQRPADDSDTDRQQSGSGVDDQSSTFGEADQSVSSPEAAVQQSVDVVDLASRLPPDVPWCPPQCECFNYHETVDCSRQSLGQMPTLPPTVRRLYLEGNQIEAIDADRLAVAANLSVLIIEDNRLTEFDAGRLLVCRLLHLQELDLSGNQIRSFLVSSETDISCPSSSSSSSPSLKELNLSHNRLTTIPANLSVVAPYLEILLLSHNEITSAAFDASYSAMTSLRYVDLGHNDIRSLLADDLDPIRWTPSSSAVSLADRPSVDSLNLADCGLTSVDATALDGLDNLTSLTLTRCLVNQSALSRALASPAFRQRLQRLDLSETFVRNLTVELVGEFTGLLGLFASYCDLRAVDPDLFARLSNLETLDVDGGSLERLDAIGQLSRLRRFSARMNQLDERLMLGHIDTLETVDLSYNRFRRLASGWIGGSDIQLVNVSHNDIVAVDRDAISPSSAVATLDLSFNQLGTFPDLGAVKLSRLDVSHNGMSLIADGAFDSLHDYLNELDLGYNDFHEFAPGVFLEFRLLQYLSLAHNNLGQAFRAGREKLGSLFDSLQLIQVLDLSYNGISVIRPPDLLASLRHLNTLYLEGNLIRDLTDAGLASTRVLAKLVLTGNQLNAPDVGILSRMEYLEEVDLGNNPFECTCAVTPFLEWTNSTTVTIIGNEDVSRYQCDFPPVLRGQSIFGPAGRHRCTSAGSWLGFQSGLEPGGSYRPRSDSIVRSSAVYGGLAAVACLTGAAATITAGALVCRYGELFRRVKGLRYRWQIRYREVSAVETNVDQKS